MKKIILFGLLLTSTIITLAQKPDTSSIKTDRLNGNNELKLNLVSAVTGFPELNYERIIKDDMSVGIAVLVGLDKKVKYSFGVIPNYRVYFGSKKANGFFIELNAAVISSKGEYYDYSHIDDISYPQGYYPNIPFVDKIYTSFGLGAAAGVKFMTKSGFVCEVFAGAGRLFGNSISVYPRGGLTFGQRF